jgi:hypothetical protein
MDPSPLEVDFGDLMVDAGINIPLLPEDFRGQGNEGMYIVDNPADVVGNPSRGIRGMRGAFKDDDLQVRSQTAGLRSRAHPCGVPADNHQSLSSHMDSPSLRLRINAFQIAAFLIFLSSQVTAQTVLPRKTGPPDP